MFSYYFFEVFFEAVDEVFFAAELLVFPDVEVFFPAVLLVFPEVEVFLPEVVLVFPEVEVFLPEVLPVLPELAGFFADVLSVFFPEVLGFFGFSSSSAEVSVETRFMIPPKSPPPFPLLPPKSPPRRPPP